MTRHAVTLRVKPCLGIECKFWLGDDGWNGTTEHPLITVQATSRPNPIWNSHWGITSYCF